VLFRSLLDDIEKNPRCPKALYKLGLYYHHDRGELRKAENQYRASLAIKRDEVVLNELGTLLEDQADLLRDEAKDSYLAANEIQPTVQAYFNLARNLAQQQQIDKAEKAYETAHAIAPDNCDVLFNLGNLHGEQGALDKAEAAYQTALGIAPEARTYCNLGVLLKRKGELGRAEAAFRAALAIDPDDDLFRRNLDSLVK